MSLLGYFSHRRDQRARERFEDSFVLSADVPGPDLRGLSCERISQAAASPEFRRLREMLDQRAS